jgi:hypothetical protein
MSRVFEVGLAPSCRERGASLISKFILAIKRSSGQEIWEGFRGGAVIDRRIVVALRAVLLFIFFVHVL